MRTYISNKDTEPNQIAENHPIRNGHVERHNGIIWKATKLALKYNHHDKQH